jgi:hypothetical protein
MWLKMYMVGLIVMIAGKVSADELSRSDSENPIVGADIQMLPEKLVLGRETEADIHIRLLNSVENKAACRNIQVRVNTGEIQRVSRIAEGVFTAHYLLPDEFYPQFVLISVFGYCGGREIVGISAHPLHGSGEVTVQSTPYTKVSLDIAGESFGPKLTDQTGLAEIPVVVKPGIFTGTAGDKVIDLNLPPVKRIVAFAVPPAAAAGSETGSLIWMYAVDKFGEPLREPDIVLHAARGRLSPITAVAPGIFRARYVPPVQVEGGNDRITAGLKADSASTETLEITIYPGGATQISTTVAPNRHSASSTDPVTVFSEVFDKKGNPAPARLTAVANLGELTPTVSNTPGQYRWTWTLPSYFKGKRQAEVSVYSKTDTQLKSVARVDLVAGEPVTVTIVKPDDAVPSDGWTAVPMRVKAVDRSANPVGGLHIEIASDKGTLSPLVENDNAEYSFEFTPPLKRSKDNVTITAEIESCRAESPVALTPRLYRFALIPEVGYFNNLGNINAPMFSLSADVSLWKIVSGLYTGIDLEYYFSHADGQNQISSTIHAFPILALVGYHFMPVARWLLDFNAGVGPFAVSHILSQQNAYQEKSGAVELGVSASVGISFRAGIGYVAFRIQYIYAKSTQIESLSGMLGGLAFMIGYRFEPI